MFTSKIATGRVGFLQMLMRVDRWNEIEIWIPTIFANCKKALRANHRSSVFSTFNRIACVARVSSARSSCGSIVAGVLFKFCFTNLVWIDIVRPRQKLWNRLLFRHGERVLSLVVFLRRRLTESYENLVWLRVSSLVVNGERVSGDCIEWWAWIRSWAFKNA